MTKKIMTSLLLFMAILLSAAEFQLSNIKITVANKKYDFAAKELKKHLELTGNKLAPGKGALEIIIGRAGERVRLAPEESRWLFKGGKLYFWGDDKRDRNGTLFAVYGFLENKLGIRWLYPGDEGIMAPPQKSISFKENESYRRTPAFKWNYVRAYRWNVRFIDRINSAAPPALRIDKKTWLANGEENRLFTLRHRHGRTEKVSFGHAFVKWPKRFAKTRMDYFGVSPYGKPMLAPNPKNSKLCLSNPAVIDQIIADWKARKCPKLLNISPNDGTPGFCRCEKCMALDTRKPGENFYAHLTDRYLNFWNRVIARAKAIRPDVLVATYVYSYYRFPPRRERIEHPDNMLCGLVPQLGEDSRALFEAWKKAGMKHCSLRPNDLCYHGAMLRFMEKRIYDKFQETRRHFELWGNDYDAALGTSSIDLESYVASRMLAFPEKSFDEIAAEYYSGFGKAAALVKSVYDKLRPMGEAIYDNNYRKRGKVILDDSELETEANNAFITAQEKELAKLEKFDIKQLSPQEKIRFNRFKLILEHSILAGKFLEEGKLDVAGKKNKFPAAAKALLDFRHGKGNAIKDMWGTFFNRLEKTYWNRYQPYRDTTGNDNVKLADLAAGWRNSFDAPSMQEWKKRSAFKTITNKEASFDRYSIEAKPTKKAAIVMFRTGIPVTPGARYNISFDVKAPAGGNFRLRVVANGKTLKYTKAVAKGNNWVMGESKFTIPKGVEKVTMYVLIDSAPQGGFIDNIVLTREKK